MKKIFLILIFISCYSCSNTDNYLTSQLTLDFPKELKAFKKEKLNSDLKFTELETGLDSLKIYFGSMTKNNKTDYWISSSFKGNNFTRGVSLKLKDSLNFLTEDVTFEINPFDPITPYSTSFRILHDPLSNTVKYLWLNNGDTKKFATIIKVDLPIKQEKKFPEITINSVFGETISTNDFNDKIVIINWWSPSCSPCVKEIPELNKIAKKYKLHEDILFLAITNDKKERVQKFLEKHEFNYTQGIGNKNINKVFKGFQPQNIIINKKGITQFYLAGYSEQTPMLIEKAIEQLLSKK